MPDRNAFTRGVVQTLDEGIVLLPAEVLEGKDRDGGVVVEQGPEGDRRRNPLRTLLAPARRVGPGALAAWKRADGAVDPSA